MLLPSLISLRHPPSQSPTAEDIFSSSLGSIFTDDLQNQHGTDADTTIIYNSRKFGNLEFRTADVNGEEQRRKFAHYLWNAGILMAELVGGQGDARKEGRDSGVWVPSSNRTEAGEGNEWWVSEEEEKCWDVNRATVLELGAGVGLAGIVSALAGAREVTVTDYPAPAIVDAIATNVAKNVPDPIKPRVRVEGHKWGDLSTPFAEADAHKYTYILAADCFWMPHEHDNLALSMLHFLSYASEARILCIGGFHTGRAKIAAFFEETVPKGGLEIEDIFEMDANGKRREWAKERDGGKEDVGERKKWLTIARLRRPARCAPSS